KDVGDLSARSFDEDLRFGAKGQSGKSSACEFHHELCYAFRARQSGLTTAAHASGDAAREICCREGLIRGPIETIVETQGRAGLCRLFRDPEGDDVVVNFIVGWNLHQLDAAASPVAQRLNPEAGPVLIPYSIEVVLPIAVPLHQAEAPGAQVAEGGNPYLARIVEGPPDAFAAAGPELEPVTVMHFWAPILAKKPTVFGVPEHRGKGSDAQALDVAAQEQPGGDLHLHPLGWPAEKTEGAGQARTIQEGVDGSRVRWQGRNFDPEGDEIRELFRLGGGDIDGDSPCRETILAELSDRSEVGGPEKGQPIL